MTSHYIYFNFVIIYMSNSASPTTLLYIKYVIVKSLYEIYIFCKEVTRGSSGIRSSYDEKTLDSRG